MAPIRVGVVGGGQLAWMMAGAAEKLGLELIVQTPNASDPGARAAAQRVWGEAADATATAQLAQLVDVITFENEFVDLEALKPLVQQGNRFFPSLETLAVILDKYDQHQFLAAAGVNVAKFALLEAAVPESLNLPLVLKACRHGYDGYGTFIVKTQAELDQVLAKSSTQRWLLEAFVPFERELAVMAARAATGEMAIYPVVETVQEEQVCRRVFMTQDLPAAAVAQVEAAARRILEQLNYVGILGIEFFLTADGQILVNELAPRTHNSGHYSLDACVTSQFEQQLRAVCGLPLGSPALTSAGAVMVNLLGYETSDQDYLEKRQRLSALPQAHLYWYGKTSRLGRKLGHVTVLLPQANRAEAERIAAQIEQVWYP
ncbi:MAG: 5-(carboxyamino)imidazole ribonucleotide synthase [Pegethrix bostrychoides GSE-TBD4-15B]|uniref:N5-carboxyaminoimidazole ribonucleotide synthase n=1 Tax=Pegethrix bostrychoides GSE-TBD4-15B TaxID=2839662 RepID=A0A951PAL3_9CYAN|nr:5-(carboxyamino)imidazole ribonucleotide synthase [Pegethrix bostrychoides GSE-TBD4-15B]